VEEWNSVPIGSSVAQDETATSEPIGGENRSRFHHKDPAMSYDGEILQLTILLGQPVILLVFFLFALASIYYNYLVYE
jgi:hypothetical protein